MYDLLSAPNVSPDQLKNFVTSSKTMKALYWGLTCRCEEKWNAWNGALIGMTQALLRMAAVYGAAKCRMYSSRFPLTIVIRSRTMRKPSA